MMWLFWVIVVAVTTVNGLFLDDIPARGSDAHQLALRAQRDASMNTTLDQLSFLGIDLNGVLWDHVGYTVSTLSTVREMLDLGVNLMEMDVYWNERTRVWQLCPWSSSSSSNTYDQVETQDGISCEFGLNLTTVLNTFETFFRNTNTRADVDILELFLNVKSLGSDPESSSRNTGISLASNFGPLSGYVYAPSDLQDDAMSAEIQDGDFPSLQYFLFSKYKRILPIVVSSELPANSTYGDLIELDSNGLFINGYNVNISGYDTSNVSMLADDVSNVTQSLMDISDQQFRVVYNVTNEDEITEYLKFGYSPMIQSNIDLEIGSVLNVSFWSWGTDQPMSSSPNYNHSETNQSTINDRQVAYICALSYNDSWVVDNCYNEHPVACRSNYNNYHWEIYERATYFDAGCPRGFSFRLPQSSLEYLALQSVIRESNFTSAPVWIDMNAITLDQCWVSGGPYASCPYAQYVTGSSSFLNLILPTSVVLFVLLVGIIGLRFDTTPIQRNRRHWKKLINEFNEQDYEGVPS